MSRGFDGFEIGDFRDPQWESERYRPGRESSQGRGGSSPSGADVRSKLEKLREAESIGDQVAAPSREHLGAGRSPLPRETKQVPSSPSVTARIIGNVTEAIRSASRKFIPLRKLASSE